MERYDIDLPAERLLGRIMEDYRGRKALMLMPAREFVAVPPGRALAGLGEGEDLTVTLAVGTLDARPVDNGWTLHIRLEDSAGVRAPEDASAADEPEAIDFESFWTDFVDPRQATAYAWVSAQTLADKADFDAFFGTQAARRVVGA